mmetsp:Transcript_18355/g.32376  ORF Transcript_18355/g.32376 Transcript_18355/m.32376 type:complete len:86 (-) Transcript_18355:301-558(-)
MNDATTSTTTAADGDNAAAAAAAALVVLVVLGVHCEIVQQQKKNLGISRGVDQSLLAADPGLVTLLVGPWLASWYSPDLVIYLAL